MNEYQKHRFTKRIITCLYNNLANKHIAIFGFAFKKNTSDTRESPAITLVNNLVAERAKVAVYDPKVQEAQVWRELLEGGGDLNSLKLNVSICKSAYTACEGADAVVIMTEWDEFSNKSDECGDLTDKQRQPLAVKSMDLDDMTDTGDVDMKTSTCKVVDWAKVGSRMRKPMFVFDGRNMLDHVKLEEMGFRVEAIGRASSSTHHLFQDE